MTYLSENVLSWLDDQALHLDQAVSMDSHLYKKDSLLLSLTRIFDRLVLS